MVLATYGHNHGRISGLKKHEFLQTVFEMQPINRCSDKTLCKMMREEFPDCKTAWERKIPELRNRYNRGELRFQKNKPRKACPRYDSAGNVFPRRRGPRPLVR